MPSSRTRGRSRSRSGSSRSSSESSSPIPKMSTSRYTPSQKPRPRSRSPSMSRTRRARSHSRSRSPKKSMRRVSRSRSVSASGSDSDEKVSQLQSVVAVRRGVGAERAMEKVASSSAPRSPTMRSRSHRAVKPDGHEVGKRRDGSVSRSRSRSYSRSRSHSVGKSDTSGEGSELESGVTNGVAGKSGGKIEATPFSRSRSRSPIGRRRSSKPHRVRKNKRHRRSGTRSDSGSGSGSGSESSNIRPSRKSGRNRSPRRSPNRKPQPQLTEEQKAKIKQIEASRPAKKEKKSAEEIFYNTRAGGAYIPPHKLKAMQANLEDKEGMAYQRMSWDALKKSLNGVINKVNVANIKIILPELFRENLVRGKGLFARACIQAQQSSPGFTAVYAALVAIVNTKLPENGELILKRLILNFRRSYKRNDKTVCLATVKFIAHLVNQQVAHEVIALQLMTLLLEKPTSDSVEVAIGFIKEVGKFLQEVSPQAKALNAIFERLRGILHDGQIDVRVQYMIEVVMEVRKGKFKDNPMIPEGLDLVEEDDQIIHFLSLDEEGLNGMTNLDVFKFDPNFKDNEDKYVQIKKGILGESSDEEGGSSTGSDNESESGDESEPETAQGTTDMVDMTGVDRVALRRTIYLTVMSSLDYEEVCHKLLKNTLKPGMEDDLVEMVVECCSQERSYLKFYGLMAQRFCEVNKGYQMSFEQCFVFQYNMIHRLETNRLRNVAKVFAHIFFTDAVNWTTLEAVHLNEEETNASSRIFIKVFFQEICEHMGLAKLNERLQDPFLAPHFRFLLPKDHPRNTRFAINFFTSIGLGGLTDDLREHLKNAPKLIMQQRRGDAESSDSSDSDSDSDSDSSSSSGSDSSSSSNSSSTNSSSTESDSDSVGVDRRTKGRENQHRASRSRSRNRGKRAKR
eukprot:CFRG4431T1